jgi:hypothetical protein
LTETRHRATEPAAELTELAPPMRRLLVLVLLTCLHTVVTVALLLVVFGGGMARFDAGTPAPLVERVAKVALRVLSFPVLPTVSRLPREMQPHGFPGEHLVFLANGLLWALGLVALWTWRRNQSGRLFRRRRVPNQASMLPNARRCGP